MLSEAGARKRISNKINPRIAVMASLTSGFDPCPHWWENDSFTTVLLLFPAFVSVNYFYMNPVGTYHIIPKTIVPEKGRNTECQWTLS